jgi:hypothetical protein
VNIYCGKPPALEQGDRDRLVKLLGLLGSDNDGERSNAARMAYLQIRRLGVSWDEVLRPPALPNRPLWWREKASAILKSGLATEWETEFCVNLLDHWRGNLSDRQQEVLQKIFAKCTK